MLELRNKTIIASILFLDIVGYSKRPVELQLEIKNHLNQVIADAIGEIPEEERVLLDTGDGAALCFLSSPEEALEVAISIRNGVDTPEQKAPGAYRLCLGINLGPVRVIKDINGQRNIIGDGINAAQRVLSFAATDQILVSRAFFDIVVFLTAENMERFRYHGIHKDKHGREHEVYEVLSDGSLNLTPEAETSAEPPPPPIPDQKPRDSELHLPEDTLLVIEQLYARYVGPIAHVLMRRRLKSAASLPEVCEKLKELISDPQDKAEFELRFCQTLTDQGEAPPSPPAAPPPPAAKAPASTGAEITSEQAERATQKLAQVIGPIAKMLVKRETKQAANFRELCQRLAEHIEDPQEREQFLQDVNGV